MRFSYPLRTTLILAAAVLLPVAGNADQTRSSGWVTPKELLKFTRSMNGTHWVPTKIACKGDSSSSFIRDSILLNITFTPDTEHRPWKWVWGTDMGHYTHYLMPKGWKLVSQSGFTRPNTGLFVPCGVYAGPPGTSALYGAPTH